MEAPSVAQEVATSAEILSNATEGTRKKSRASVYKSNSEKNMMKKRYAAIERTIDFRKKVKEREDKLHKLYE